MITSLRWPVLVCLVLALAGAAPSLRPEDAVRRGNAAYDGEQYDQALRLYEQGEEHITDPGILAFNEAATLYRAGRFREAELHYRRSLEGASGPRRARALYDLGNCLLHQAAGNDAGGLQEAMTCYDRCAADPDADPDLRARAAYNRELACLLWHEARQQGKEAPPKESGDTNEPPKDRHEQGTEAGDPASRSARPAAGSRVPAKPGGHQEPLETPQQAPGKGNLPVLPDRDELVPLSPEDAAAYLEQAAARILRERREYRQSAAPALPNVKDW
jgi:tetratricopeptide (TPR) repeat protein